MEGGLSKSTVFSKGKKEVSAEKKRKLYYEVKDYLEKGAHHVFLLLGLRKTGKTKLLTQLQDELGSDLVYYMDCRETKLTTDTYYDLFDLPQKYILIDELGYFEGFDEYMGRLLEDLNGTGKKFILTSSSYGTMKQLAREKLGASRAKVFELFPLSFEEYLYFSNKISEYGEDYNPSDNDLQDFYRLKGLPDGMDFIIDRDYMEGVFKDTEVAIDNQMGTVRTVELERKHYTAIIDLIAYTLNNKISIKKFRGGVNLGVQELGAAGKGLKFSETLVGFANSVAISMSPSDIGKIIAYLYHAGFLFADLFVNEKEEQSPVRIIGEFASVRSNQELSVALKTYTLSVISPLIYTRLMVDIENFTDKFVESRALYGELYKLTMKSEHVYGQGYSAYHATYKYVDGVIEVDLVNIDGLLIHYVMEITISHKKNKDHNTDYPYRGKSLKRILTDREGVFETDGNIRRIGYPKALLMVSNKTIYDLEL